MKAKTRAWAAASVLGLVFLCAPGGGQEADSGGSDCTEELVREVWALKHVLLHPNLKKKAGLEKGDHNPSWGFATASLDPEAAGALGLERGWGLRVTSVHPGVQGIEEGDVLLRVRSGFGRWRPATPSTIKYTCLPGDDARLDLSRDGRRLEVSVRVGCRCGHLETCPFCSPMVREDRTGWKRRAIRPFLPNPDERVHIVRCLAEAWRKAIEEYYEDLRASGGNYEKVEDIKARLDRASREQGVEDWPEFCTQASVADPKGYTRCVQEMTRFTVEQAKKYATEMMEKKRKEGEEGK